MSPSGEAIGPGNQRKGDARDSAMVSGADSEGDGEGGTVHEALLARHRELEQEWRENLEEIRRNRENMTPDDDSVVVEEAILSSRIEQVVSEIRNLEEAIARFAEGAYGVCEGCGGSIGAERLGANPSAVRCRDCQRKLERGF